MTARTETPVQLAFVFDDDGHGPDLVHVLMPNMRYACGGCVCGCSGPRGTFTVGAADRWDEVTCEGCRAPGRAALVAEARRQQRSQA